MPSAILRADTFKTLIKIRIQRLRTESTQVKFLMDEAQQSHDREAISSFSRTNIESAASLVIYIFKYYIGVYRVRNAV